MKGLLTDDAGMSLVELVVAIVVGGLFAALLSLMFVNGWTLQERSYSRDTATGQATVVKTTMADALRNAASVRVSGSNTRVDALVAVPSSSYTGTWTWECRAWVFTDKSIRYSAGSTIRNSDPVGWPVLAGKSAQRPLDSVTGKIAGAPFALLGSKGVQIAFDITAVGRDTEKISVSDGMTAQTVATTAAIAGAPACWN